MKNEKNRILYHIMDETVVFKYDYSLRLYYEIRKQLEIESDQI